MTRKINLFILIVVLLSTSMISGCLTTGRGPQFSQALAPEAGNAVIYVYRPRFGMTASTNPGIKLNDKIVVTTLYELSYFPISVTPGSYTFTPKQFGIFKTSSATVHAKAGQVYYVRFDVKVGHLQFSQVDRDEAKAYMATCYRVAPKLVADSRVKVGQVAPVVKPTSIAEPATSSQPKQQLTSQPRVQVAPATLRVEAQPAATRIRILNIKPIFKQGIELNAGRYHVEVTAAGYQKYKQWIALKGGEKRTLQIALKKEKPVPVVVSAPTVVTKKKKASVVKVPANASADEKRYAAMFASSSSSSIDIRNAAKNLYYHHSGSAYLASAAEQCLLQRYNAERVDKVHADAMAWLCKALANTQDKRFVDTLSHVSTTAKSRKIRRYADKSLNQLR